MTDLMNEATEDSGLIVRTWIIDAPTIVRAPDGQDQDAHYIEGMVAPYDVEINASDVNRSGNRVPIREVIRRGAFKQTINRRGGAIPLTFYHPSGIDPQANHNYIGVSSAWTDTPQGQRATFRMMNSEKAREALELVHENLVSGLSIAGQAVQTKIHRTNGKPPLMERSELNLHSVALVPNPAYAMAGIDTVRQEVIDDDPRITEMLAAIEKIKASLHPHGQ